MDGLGTDGWHKPSCERGLRLILVGRIKRSWPPPPPQTSNLEKSIYYVCNADLAAHESEARYEPAAVNKASHSATSCIPTVAKDAHALDMSKRAWASMRARP